MPMRTRWHQILFWSNPCRGRLVRPVSLAMRIRSSARAWRRWRSSRSASWPLGVLVSNAVMRYPSTSVKRSLGAGVGPFAAGNDLHARWPPGQREQVGELGHGGAGADLTLGVVGRRPCLLGNLLQQVGGVSGQGEPDGALHAATVGPGREVLGATGAVGTDQDLLARSGRVDPGHLGQRVLGHGDVVLGGVGPGVAGAEQDRQRFSGAHGPVIEEGQQRVEPVGAFVGAGRLLLLAVRDHDRGRRCRRSAEWPRSRHGRARPHRPAPRSVPEQSRGPC